MTEDCSISDAAQPVAWRVKNDFGHWYVTQDKALADTYRDVEKKDVQPLYLAAQPPAAPVETAIAALAKRFWSIHPKEIQDLGITREQFYEREMRALFATLVPNEPQKSPRFAGNKRDEMRQNIEARLKAVRQEIVKYIDSGADRSHTVSIPQGKLEDWFDGLEAISGNLPAQPQESLTEEHS